MLAERCYQSGKHNQGYEQRNHARPHTQRNARFLLQSVSRNDRIGNQRIGCHDAAQQEGSLGRVVEQPDAHAIGEEERYKTGEQAIDKQSRLVLFHAFHIHLQCSEEHDVIESHLSEELKRRVALQDIQSVFAYEHTCQHHTDDVRDTEFTHDDRGKEDDEEHYEEYQRRVCDREVLSDMEHRLSSFLLYLKRDFCISIHPSLSVFDCKSTNKS